MYALFLYALSVYERKSANSICVVAIGAMHFSVCVTSVAHTFYFYGGKKMGKKIIALLSALFMVFSFVSCANNEQNVYVYGDEVHTAEPQTEETEEAENENYYEEVETTKKQVVTTKKQQTTKKQTTENSNSSGHVHNYSAASCTSPKTCSCGKTAGTALGHSYSSANCTSPKICSRCGATSGSALGHNFQNATCTSAKKCTRCGKTSGSALGHNYVNNKCSRCGKVDPDSLPVDLNSIACIDSKNYSYWVSVKDTYGNMYSGCNYFANYSTSYAVFNLGGKFSSFSCDVIAYENMASSGVAIIEFYVDGELKHTVENYTRTTGPVNVKINTNYGDKLTVKVYRTGGMTGGNIGLVNTELKK